MIGILGCALGGARRDLSWANDLTIHVRVDRPGTPTTDVHMVGGVPRTAVASSALKASPARTAKDDHPGRSPAPVLTDAAFLVTITTPDSGEGNTLADRLATALTRPRWPLYLGRKSCPPAHPVLLGTPAHHRKPCSPRSRCIRRALGATPARSHPGST